MVKRTGYIQLACLLPEEYAEKLKVLSDRTEVPQTRLVRQALELLFKKHGISVPEAKKKTRSSAS